MIMFGSLFRLAVDALLVSAFLAGVRRSTGLTYVLLAPADPAHAVSDLRSPKYPTRTFAVSASSRHPPCLIRPQSYCGHISSLVRLVRHPRPRS
jgi:hypothetical protein